MRKISPKCKQKPKKSKLNNKHKNNLMKSLTIQRKKQMQVQQDDDQKDASDENKQGQQMEVTPTPLSAEEREKAQQLSQLLRKVPDDPSILLRNKMQLEYQNRGRNQSPQGVKKSW